MAWGVIKQILEMHVIPSVARVVVVEGIYAHRDE